MPYEPAVILWVDYTVYPQIKEDIFKMNSRLIANDTTYYKYGTRIEKVLINRSYKGSSLKRRDKIYCGGNGLTGFLALSCTVLEQYEEIYLLGYDFGNVTEERDKRGKQYTHWYQDEFAKTKFRSGGVGRKRIYLNKEGKILNYVHDFNKYTNHHNKIFTVDKRSHVEAFPKISWEEFFSRIQ